MQILKIEFKQTVGVHPKLKILLMTAALKLINFFLYLEQYRYCGSVKSLKRCDCAYFSRFLVMRAAGDSAETLRKIFEVL